MVSRIRDTYAVSPQYEYADGVVSKKPPWMFLCRTRKYNSSRRYEYDDGRPTNIFAQNLCRNIHIETFSYSNATKWCGTSSLPIGGKIVRSARICMVYHPNVIANESEHNETWTLRTKHQPFVEFNVNLRTFSAPAAKKLLPHSSHWWGRCPVCDRIW